MTISSFWRIISLAEFRAHRAEFYRDLAEMYRRGEALVGFLEGEIANSQLTRQFSRARALRAILRRHLAGENASVVSHLLQGVVPRADTMMLVAVDRALDKPRALEGLAEAVERQHDMLRAVLSSCALPALALPICAALVDVLGRVILSVDELAPVYVRESLWEGVNGWARTIAAFVESHGATALSVAAFALATLTASLPRWRGRARCRADALPVFGLYRDFQAGMLFSCMAMMLRAGQTLQSSLEDLAQRSSPWMRWQLGRVLIALDENPTAILDAFRRGILSPSLLARAMTLNRSSATFADVLVQLGTSEASRVVLRVKRAALTASAAVLGSLASMALFMGVASITVPGRLSTLMEPSTLMLLKATYEAQHPTP